MTPHEIVALLCPSCGGGASHPSREMPFGAEFHCDHCGVTSVLIIDRALVPLSTLLKQGEKVCTTCGRMALREARFCQEGHALVRKCVYKNCHSEFAVDHQRCDFCGRRQQLPQLHEVYDGTVMAVSQGMAHVTILDCHATLWSREIANRVITDARDELKVGEQIRVKVIRIDESGGIPGIIVSSKVLGRP